MGQGAARAHVLAKRVQPGLGGEIFAFEIVEHGGQGREVVQHRHVAKPVFGEPVHGVSQVGELVVGIDKDRQARGDFGLGGCLVDRRRRRLGAVQLPQQLGGIFVAVVLVQNTRRSAK